MERYDLDIETKSKGCYLSTEQIDLLTIVSCKTKEELETFIENCEQFRGIFFQTITNENFDLIKKQVFKEYQKTFVSHDEKESKKLINILMKIGLSTKDINEIFDMVTETKPLRETIIEYLKDKNYNIEEITKFVHRYINTERDQIKSVTYEEIASLYEELNEFNKYLIGSGRIYDVTYKNQNGNYIFDFYHTINDLNFAKKQDKHVRYHSLLNRPEDTTIFNGMSKQEIIDLLKKYVKESIDFINEYNKNNKASDGKGIITSVDLFNELVSFNKSEDGKYYNVWEEKFGITANDLVEVFNYAKENKGNLSFVYNEAFVENEEKRSKILEVLSEIEEKSPGLIDTFGTQMHIFFKTPIEEIKKCFEELKELTEKGYKVEITEFDMSLDKEQIVKASLDNDAITVAKEARKLKRTKINEISQTIKDTKIEIEGKTYWSITDTLDHNLERQKTKLKNEGREEVAKRITSSFAGYYNSNELIHLYGAPKERLIFFKQTPPRNQTKFHF